LDYELLYQLFFIVIDGALII